MTRTGSGRTLSRAELAQRQDAPTVHGAYSEARIRPRSEVLYQRYRKALNKAVGRTTPAERRQLLNLARFEARIEAAEQHLAEHAIQGLFVDAHSGRLHPLVDRVDGWIERASRVVQRLPERAVKALGEDHQHDLARQLMRSSRRAS